MPNLKMALRLRTMQMDDMADVVSIERATNPFPWSLKNFKTCLHARYVAWVWVDSANKIIAYAILQAVLDEVHVLNICVKKEVQRQGVGSMMMKHIIDFAVKRVSSLVLLEVRQSNQPARDLYLSLGFNEMSIRQGYYPAKRGREDAILMALDLTSLH